MKVREVFDRYNISELQEFKRFLRIINHMLNSDSDRKFAGLILMDAWVDLLHAEVDSNE